MFNSNKYMLFVFFYLGIALGMLFYLYERTNGQYLENSPRSQHRRVLVAKVQTASPALITAGRNIAFETGNAVANAPAAYLTMLDCCESDEAIADRIAMSRTTCRIIRRRTQD